MEKKINKAAYLLMLTFIITTLLAPVTIMNKVLFVLLMGWTAILMLRTKEPRPKLVWSAFCIICIFTYGFLLSLPFSIDNDIARQFFLASFILILIHFIEFYAVDFDRAALFGGKFLVVVTGVYWLLLNNPGFPFSGNIVSWFVDVSQSTNTERDFFGANRVGTLAVSTVAFIFVPWCLSLIKITESFKWKDLIWLILFGLVIMISGRRGLALIALVFFVYITSFYVGVKVKLLLVCLSLVTIPLALIYIFQYTSIFSPTEESNSIKIGHIYSYLEHSEWINSIFGSGLGSFYYSKGFDALTSHTEITPLDLARYVGVPLAILAYILMLFPRLYRKPFFGQRKHVFFAFFLYLILSLTNPVLINSFGMLVVLWYWSTYRKPRSSEGVT